jgi:hypothetical protein
MTTLPPGNRCQAGPTLKDFMPVMVKYSDWLRPDPMHQGERILWSDGSVHGLPENESEYVTVLRRRAKAARSHPFKDQA